VNEINPATWKGNSGQSEWHQVDDLGGRTVRGGLAKLCGQAAIFVIRLAFLMIMARLLLPEDFGLVAMVTVVTGIYDFFTNAGLSSATVQKATITDGQISNLFWINLLIGSVLGVLCLVTAPVLAAFYQEPRLFWVTIALAGGLVINAAGVQHFAILQRQVRYVALATIEILSQFLSSAAGIALALGGLRYWALVAAAILAPAAMTAGMWAVTCWIPALPRRDIEINRLQSRQDPSGPLLGSGRAWAVWKGAPTR
jgi:PST family polysaccharide transporter